MEPEIRTDWPKCEQPGCANEAKAGHSCPYMDEVGSDEGTNYCYCCDSCRHECAMEVYPKTA